LLTRKPKGQATVTFQKRNGVRHPLENKTTRCKSAGNRIIMDAGRETGQNRYTRSYLLIEKNVAKQVDIKKHQGNNAMAFLAPSF